MLLSGQSCCSVGVLRPLAVLLGLDAGLDHRTAGRPIHLVFSCAILNVLDRKGVICSICISWRRVGVLLLRSPAISLRFTILGGILEYVTAF